MRLLAHILQVLTVRILRLTILIPLVSHLELAGAMSPLPSLLTLVLSSTPVCTPGVCDKLRGLLP